MDPFQLTEDAILDIDAIWLYLLEKEGVETADRIVTELFKGFYKLAEIPNTGHRRVDLTSWQVLFYRVFSYLVIYEPGSKPLRIFGVLSRQAEPIAHSAATLMSAMQMFLLQTPSLPRLPVRARDQSHHPAQPGRSDSASRRPGERFRVFSTDEFKATGESGRLDLSGAGQEATLALP